LIVFLSAPEGVRSNRPITNQKGRLMTDDEGDKMLKDCIEQTQFKLDQCLEESQRLSELLVKLTEMRAKKGN